MTTKVPRHEPYDHAITLGKSAVYPGHPITTALIIMAVYPSLGEAEQKSPEGGCPDALANGSIPGAGGNVYSALALLNLLDTDTLPLEEAIAWADESWAGCDGQKEGSWQSPADKAAGIDRSQHFKDRWKEGQDQADSLKDVFRSKVTEWLANSKG